MKRFFTLALAISSISAGAFAQGEMDAFNLSYSDLKGTARSVSMGGAFGALGGDISGVAINPAGIGVYTKSEIVTTLNFTNVDTKSNFIGNSMSKKKFNFNFDNLAFVGSLPLESDIVPIVNFGFSYNNIKSFDRKYQMAGSNLNQSFTNYVSDRANAQDQYGNITSQNAYDNADWMSVLGYRSGLITANDNTRKFSPAFRQFSSNETVATDLYVREKGYINSYDFNAGATFADIVSFGASISVTDIDYHMYSSLYENFSSNGDQYAIENELKTEGTGWQLKAGLIFRPINELRIGVAYHSPTWYNMTDYYYGGVDASWNDRVYYTPDRAYTDYKFRTPDKWVFSLAGIVGKYAIISADYELTNYSQMHLATDDGRAYTGTNSLIKNDFKNSSTLRVGAEVRFTPQFSGRVGYMWQQSPVDSKVKDDDGKYIETAGTVSQYTLVGDANYFTWGLGYKFTPSFYADVAFVVKNRKDALYEYEGAAKADLKTNEFTGLVTFGYKF